MDAFDGILDILDKFIIDKAFNRKYKLRKRLPYIIIYYIVISFLAFFCFFVGINYIFVQNIIGYFLIAAGIILLILILIPILNNNIKK